MKYGLTLVMLGDCIPFLEVTKQEFEEITASKSALLHAVYIEDKFDIVLQNYADVEIELLSRSVNDVLFRTTGWTESMSKLHQIGRRLINLLSTGRLYEDQVEHNFSELFGNSSQPHRDLKAVKSKEYDEYLGYRVISALRNYVQHRGFPIHGVTMDSQRIDEGGQSLIRTVTIPRLSIKTLELDGFKASVLQQIKASGSDGDVRPFFREYIASIGRIHAFVREQLKGRITQSEAVIAKAMEAYTSFAGTNALTGFAAVSEDENGIIVDKHDIFEDFIERRKILMEKNRSVTHCAGFHVTNGVHS